MAIIYTYPVKTTPVDADLILISDSADNNATKQVTVSSVKALTAGVTSIIAGSNVTISPTNGLGDVTINSSGGSTQPGNPSASVQYNDGAGAFAGSADLTFSTNTLAVKHTVDIKGQGQNLPAGKLKLNCELGSHAVTIEGPLHNNSGGSYTLKLPSLLPQNNQILQFTSSGNLGWINTPTGGGISFSGSTVNGIATYSSATQANVSSAFTVSGNKLSAPAGTLADPSLEVGTVGGLYAASGGIFLAHSSANAIGVNSSSIVNYKLTQFDSGLKFGSSGDTLSDYDVGTWSPKIQNVAGTVDYDTGTGSYTIIGDVVHADFSIPITATVSSTYFRLSVPFTPAGSISAINLTGNADPNTGADSTGWVSGKTISTGYGIFLSYATTNGLAVSTSATITNGNTISGSMTYKK